MITCVKQERRPNNETTPRFSRSTTPYNRGVRSPQATNRDGTIWQGNEATQHADAITSHFRVPTLQPRNCLITFDYFYMVQPTDDNKTGHQFNLWNKTKEKACSACTTLLLVPSDSSEHNFGRLLICCHITLPYLKKPILHVFRKYSIDDWKTIVHAGVLKLVKNGKQDYAYMARSGQPWLWLTLSSILLAVLSILSVILAATHGLSSPITLNCRGFSESLQNRPNSAAVPFHLIWNKQIRNACSSKIWERRSCRISCICSSWTQSAFACGLWGLTCRQTLYRSARNQRASHRYVNACDPATATGDWRICCTWYTYV